MSKAKVGDDAWLVGFLVGEWCEEDTEVPSATKALGALGDELVELHVVMQSVLADGGGRETIAPHVRPALYALAASVERLGKKANLAQDWFERAESRLGRASSPRRAGPKGRSPRESSLMEDTTLIDEAAE